MAHDTGVRLGSLAAGVFSENKFPDGALAFGRVRWQLLARLEDLLAPSPVLFGDASEDAVLNDTKIRNAKPGARDTKLTGFDGLYLLVCKNGIRPWRFAYRLDDKQKQIALGASSCRLCHCRASPSRRREPRSLNLQGRHGHRCTWGCPPSLKADIAQAKS